LTGIVVVGSYATGLTMKVDRLPCSGETLLGTGYRVDHGGKGSNQAVACARLGARVRFIAKIGHDAFGRSALDLYRDEGIDTAHISETAEAPTGAGFIIVEAATGHNCITIDPGANELLAASDIARADFSLCKVLLTQLEIPVAAAEVALHRGRAHGAITILNPAPVRELPASVLELVDVLTPNETEARVLAGEKPDATSKPEEIAGKLIARGVRSVVMTLGAQGALIVTASSSVHIPAIEVKAVDTTGAGDAFNAGLAVALASGASLQDAVALAVTTGGLAVTREGVIPSLARRAEIIQFLRRHGRDVPIWMQAGESTA